MMLINSMIEAIVIMFVILLLAGIPVGFVFLMLNQFGLIGSAVAVFLLIFFLLTLVLYLDKKK